MEFIRKMSVYTNTIQTMYITYFNRPADVAGLANWDAHMAAGMSEADLEAAFAASAEYAALTDEQQAANAANADDATALAAMVADAVEFTDAADAAYSGADANVIGSAWLAGDYATVADALDDIDPEPVPEPVEGATIYLTSSTDRGEEFNGTSSADTFNAWLEQNPFVGGVSNSLSSADVLDGGNGADSLFAELVPEFFGVTAGSTQIDVQPKTADIEKVTFEARDSGGNDLTRLQITVDAKNMTGLDEIGSLFSDGNLVIENLTTLDDSGAARNTEALTITMDHTDNFNSDTDASDLTVYFDEDYLIAGRTVIASQANYWMLDEDSVDYSVEPLLNIERDGVTLTIDGVSKTIAMDSAIADAADTWTQFAAGLQAVIDASADPDFEGLTVMVDTNNNDSTYNDAGAVVTIPAITILDAQGRALVPTGFISPADATGAFDIYGRFDNQAANSTSNPITINIDLEKVGREGEGGDLIIGGKELDNDGGAATAGNGIPVFNIDVLGNAGKLSNLGVIQSTNGALQTVNIETHADYINNATFASLTVRDGFQGSNVETINANALLGGLNIGQDTAQVNTDTFTAAGGGNVVYNAVINGMEKGVFTNTTGSGSDRITINLDGDAVDTTGTSFAVNAGGGNNTVTVTMEESAPVIGGAGVSVATTATLNNLKITTGSGMDMVTLIGGSTLGPLGFLVDGADGDADFDIVAGAATDTVYIDSFDDTNSVTAAKGSWAFGTATSAQTFVGRVLYHATLTIAYAGFESTVEVETNSVGNFVANQMTINAAIVEAISGHSELNRLLNTTSGTSDQQLMVTSNFEGLNGLSVALTQPAVVAGVAGAGQVSLNSSDSTALIAGLVATTAADSTVAATAVTSGALGATGVVGGPFMAISAGGSADETSVTNVSTIDMGTGTHDLVILNSDMGSANTLVFSNVWDKVSVVNFFSDAAVGVGTVGTHKLDFTHWLDDQTSTSGSAVSAVGVARTVSANTDAASIDIGASNEVLVITDFVSGAVQTWDALSASALQAVLNGGAAYGSIAGGTATATASAGTYAASLDAIIMIESDNNPGQYKVFNADVVDATDTFAITLVGTVDFGNDIDGLVTANLV